MGRIVSIVYANMVIMETDAKKSVRIYSNIYLVFLKNRKTEKIIFLDNPKGKLLAIILGTILPFFAIVILASFIIFCCCNRRK